MVQRCWSIRGGRGVRAVRWGLMGVVLSWTALAEGVELTVVELQREAWVRGPEVRLGEIARIEGPAAGELSGEVVARFSGGSGLQVKLADIERILERRAVHRGLIVVRGHVGCQVRQAERVEEGQRVADLAKANPQEEVTVEARRIGGRLRQQVEDVLRRMAGERGEELEIRFAEAEERQLDQAVEGRRIEIQPQSQVFPGRIPVVIRFQGPEGSWQTLRVTAEVGWRTEAVVLKRGISRGQVLSREDLEVRPVVIRTMGQPVRDVERAVGKAARGILRAGTILLEEYLEPAVLVRRGELVTVRCRQGALMVTTVGRAMEDGALGQVIEVRNEKSRQSFLARVSGSGEVLVTEDSRSAGEEGTDKRTGGGSMGAGTGFAEELRRVSNGG